MICSHSHLLVCRRYTEHSAVPHSQLAIQPQWRLWPFYFQYTRYHGLHVVSCVPIPLLSHWRAVFCSGRSVQGRGVNVVYVGNDECWAQKTTLSYSVRPLPANLLHDEDLPGFETIDTLHVQTVLWSFDNYLSACMSICLTFDQITVRHPFQKLELTQPGN